MIQVRETVEFRSWLDRLRDKRAKQRIDMRIGRLRNGLLGDSKAVGDGVMELRVDYGPGYRVYYLRQGEALILLLCGGDKSSQRGDIAQAKRLAWDWRQG